MMRRGYDPFYMNPREFMANPFAMMRRMSDEMDRMLEEFGGGRGESGGGLWSPVIEVSEREGNCTVHAELPGLKPEDVKVEVLDDALVIHGERRSENQQNEGGVRRTERQYGQFYRAIPLPEGAEAEQAKARFENGVLEVTVPVTNKGANRRQIPIEGSTSGSSGRGTIEGSSESAAAGSAASGAQSTGSGRPSSSTSGQSSKSGEGRGRAA
jgi:HSP20 family protein